MKPIEFVHLALIAIGLGLCVLYYPQLPETIPVHFSADGEPNGFGERSTVYALWFIWVVVAGLLFLTTRYPRFNLSTMPGLNVVEQQFFRERLAKVIPLISLLTGALILVVLILIIYAGLHDGSLLNEVFWFAYAAYMILIAYLLVSNVLQAKAFAKTQSTGMRSNH